MKRFALLLIVLASFGCVTTPNVNNRKAGRPWNYYGDLVSVYRDQTGGTKVALVWLDQVSFRKGGPARFSKNRPDLPDSGVSKDRIRISTISIFCGSVLGEKTSC